ncbi:MAG: hypothetical protein Q4D62_13620 [Planctomycetia bacterium]|nr:hypothetical protein [Planctomycetia bacterium]
MEGENPHLPSATNQPVTWVDDHETPQTAWRDGGGDCPHRILLHQRQRGNAMTGEWAEVFQMECGAEGNSLFLVYPLRPVLVTNELLPSVGVRANRSGIQLLARVVLPRTRDPQTGRAMFFYLRGGTYSTIQRWQKLRIDALASLLSREVNMLRQRTKNAPYINTEGAYMDYLVINAWCGPGRVEVAIDSMEISAVLEAKTVPRVETVSGIVPVADLPTKEGTFPPASPVQTTGKKNVVRLNQWMLTVNETPIFVRAIRHRGESLEFLHRLGFNTVWLASPPTQEMEAEATLLNLWFISPPPVPLENPTVDISSLAEPSALANLGYNRILAWDLGTPPAVTESEFRSQTSLEKARQLVRWIQDAPESLFPQRPLLVCPEKNLRGNSGIYDILLLNRNPVNSTQDFVSYGLWFRQMGNIVRDGRPLWSVVETEHPPLLRRQWEQVARGDGLTPISEKNSVPATLPLEQLRLMTYSTIMAGSRGLLFESSSRLDGNDQETLYRQKSLTLVNTELLLLEQWISQGETFTTIPSSLAHVVGAVLGIQHVRILIPLCLEPFSQYVPGVLASKNVEFLVRGLPATYQCWNMTPDGLVPLVHKRVTGGVRLELEELPQVSTLVLTQNSIIINSLSQRCIRFAPSLARLMGDIAELRMRYFLQFHGTAPLQGNEAMWYERSRHYLEISRKALEKGEYTEAYWQAQRAMRPIALMEQRLWQYHTASLSSPNACPPATSFRSLPLLKVWQEAVGKRTRGANLLPAGDLESVPAMVQAGWKHFQNDYEIPGVAARADIVRDAAKEGSLGLQMEVLATDIQMAPAMLDTPPVRLRSPAVRVGPPGTFYQVEAWVNIPRKLINSVDGLKITDTSSGEVLAERILETNGWQKVTYQRMVTTEEPISLDFSLTGYGKVWVDEVALFPLVEMAP